MAVADSVQNIGTDDIQNLAVTNAKLTNSAITLNGASVALGSSATIATPIDWQSSIVTASTITVVAGRGYWINTTSNTCTITLPASASVGDELVFTDYARTWNTNAVTIDPQTLNFKGGSGVITFNTKGQSINIVYSGAAQGWIPNTDTNYGTGSYSADLLVVGGAGSGGYIASAGQVGGGGGAGGFRTSTQTLSRSTVYTITVGAGGAGGTSNTNGSDSSIAGSGLTTITSAGGGKGSFADGSNGADGGSGGGGASASGTSGGSGNTPSTSPSQGNNGGTGAAAHPLYAAGGGGGSGSVGVNASGDTGGNGGNGTSNSITGSALSYAGGGGGASRDAIGTPSTAGAGQAGGGDGGSEGGGRTGGNGTVNTGSGGGGAHSFGGQGGNGGSGVVLLSVPTVSYSGATTGSPTITTDGSDTIIKFTGSGTYTG